MPIFRLCLSVIFLFLSVTVSSQPRYTPVKRGNPVPDILFTVTPGPGQAAVPQRFSDFRGKLLLLDFWGAYCIPCVKVLPKLTALEKEFNGQFKVLLVSTVSYGFVDSVFQRRSRVHRFYQLPPLAQVNSDSTLSQIFPFTNIPHYVWISPDGKFINQTKGDEVTADHIRSLLLGKDVPMKEKKDLYEHDFYQPMIPQLMVNDPSQLLYYSGFTRYVEGFNGNIGKVAFDSLSQTMRLTCGPVDLVSHLIHALHGRNVFGNPYESEIYEFGKRVIWKVRDSSRYSYFPADARSRTEWNRLHTFGYEAVLPLGAKALLYERMLSDIQQNFQVTATIESRKVPCLALVRTSELDKVKFPEGTDISNGRTYTDTAGVYHIRKSSLLSFIYALMKANISTPHLFVDQTNYKGSVLLALKSPLDDLEAVNAELQTKYDLKLVLSEAVLNFLVIRDLPPGQ